MKNIMKEYIEISFLTPFLIGGCHMISSISRLPDDMALLMPMFSLNLVPIIFRISNMGLIQLSFTCKRPVALKDGWVETKAG